MAKKDSSKKADSLEDNSRWGIFMYALFMLVFLALASASIWVTVIGIGFFTMIIVLLAIRNLFYPKVRKKPIKNAFAQFRYIMDLIPYI